MKIFTTILLVYSLFAFQVSTAQVLQSEDFNAGTQPAGWTVTNTGVGGTSVGTCEDGATVFSYDCMDYPQSDVAPAPPGFNGTVAVIDFANIPGPLNGNEVGCHVSPVVNTTSASNLSLSFDYENEDFAGDGNFIVEVFDGAVWQQVFIVEQDQSGSEIINVTAYSNANFQVRYCYDTEGETSTSLIWGCAVDNHIVQNVLCAQAENLAATNPNSSGATISWTDPNDPAGLSYDIEFVVSGNTPTGTPTVTDVPNPYTWTGATQGTEYDVYVRINCSAGMSTWAGPVTFLALDPPANDLCSGAIAVDVGVGMCGTTANGDNNATTDSGEGTPSCGTYAGGDIWYSFVAPASGAIALTTLTENWTSPYIGVYSGNCGSLVEVYCNLVSTASDEIITGLTGGATYYLRWWDSGNNNFGSISFCLTSGDAPPNDDCANAINVTVGASGGCGPSVTGSNNFASDSGEGTPSCGSYAGGDIWFSFVAPASGGVILEVILEDWTSPYGAVYSGSCGSLVEVGCELLSTFSTDEFTGLTPGATHYIRVWDSGNNNFGDIEFCLEASPFPPPNDDCGNAVEIPIGASGSCPGGEVNGTTTAATDDGFTSCDGTGINNGVWYYFTAPAGGEVNFEITEVSGNHEAAVFDACGGNEVFCSTTPNNIIVTGLTPSATYYMLVWSDAGSEGDHTICGQIPPMPPPNDLCANATNVDVGTGSSCGTSVTGTNVSATDSGEGAPTCGSYSGGDIWYVFTAPPSGDVLMHILLEEWTSPYIAVYSGSCGTLMEVYCNFVSTSSPEEILGLTGGATYYLRTWDSGNNNFGNIEFCLQEVPPPPANDLCANAIAINVEAFGDCPANAVTGSTISATDDGFTSCDGTGINNGVWYSFVAPATEINLQVVEVSGNHEVAIYDACGGTEVFCDITPNNETVSGLTMGNTYYLLLWSDSGSEGMFELCLQGPPPVPANDLCGGAAVLNAMTEGVHMIAGTTLGATTTDAPAACDASVDNSSVGGVWYQINTDNSFDVTVQVCDSDYDTELSLYSGSCGALVCLAGDDDGCDMPNTLGSMIQLSAGTFLQGGENEIEVRSAPTTLYAYVAGHGANSGNFTIEVIVAQVVPLELISFTAKAKQHSNVLKWVTAQEQNTEVHLIQRLRNTADSPWETIGKVDAAGFSSSVVEYEWIDETPQKRSGYRILTRDFDGTEHLSPIVTVYRDNAHEKLELLNLYPQPVDSKVIFVELFSPAEGNLEYEIIDLQGRKLIKNHKILSEGHNTLDMATGDLSSGLYILIMRNGETTMVRKITIK